MLPAVLVSGGDTSSPRQSGEENSIESGSFVTIGRGAGASVLLSAGDDTAVAASTGAEDDTGDASPVSDPSCAECVVTSSLAFKPADEASVP